MSILNQLACALGRRDEIPNVELAKKIVKANDVSAIKELVQNLNNKSKDIPADCIKVLYEVGYHKPELIAKYYKDFLFLLNHKNNRMLWGALTALSAIVKNNPKVIFDNLSAILECADKSSVIAKDHAAKILTTLSEDKKYQNVTLPILIDFINVSPENQFPTYAENAMHVLDKQYKVVMKQVLETRLPKMKTPTKIKRVEKMLKKLS